MDAAEAADLLRTDPRLLDERAFQDEFNHEAAGDHHYDDDDRDGDEDDDGHNKKRSWKPRAKDKGLKQGPGRGGYGYRREDQANSNAEASGMRMVGRTPGSSWLG